MDEPHGKLLRDLLKNFLKKIRLSRKAGFSRENGEELDFCHSTSVCIINFGTMGNLSVVPWALTSTHV